MKLWMRILLVVLVVEVLGGLSAVTMGGSLSQWYPALHKPPGTPPNWLFGPVWTLLYLMMGAAGALVWHRHAARPEPASGRGLRWFAIQLALNVGWTPLFFGLHFLGGGLVVIIALWLAIAMTIRLFAGVDRLAAGLLVPYLVWVSYATYLNAGLWWLNR